MSELAVTEDQWAIDQLERLMLDEVVDKVEPELQHFFAPGIYVRQLTVKAGNIVVGHRHREPCVNNLVKGKVVLAGGQTLAAPATFVSDEGVRKAAYVIEDMVWQNVHPIDLPAECLPQTYDEVQQLVDSLEDKIIEKSDAFIEHELKQIEEMKEIAQTLEQEVLQ